MAAPSSSIVWSATSSTQKSGTLATQIPAAVAASTSTMSYPIPARMSSSVPVSSAMSAAPNGSIPMTTTGMPAAAAAASAAVAPGSSTLYGDLAPFEVADHGGKDRPGVGDQRLPFGVHGQLHSLQIRRAKS